MATATTEIKKFKFGYTDKVTRMNVLEEPRLVITADSKHKSLWVGDQTILATVPYDEDDAVLWQLALKRAKEIAGK